MTDKERTELQNEIINGLSEFPVGRLLLAQRAGKSRIAVEIIKKSKPNSILWITPSTELATKDIPEEFIKWKASEYVDKLTTVTWMSLHKITGWYDIIILDEEQFITSNNAVNLLNGSLKGNILSMSGTKTEIGDKKLLLQSLGLKVLYKLDINKAVDIGLLANYKINVLDIPLNDTDKIIQGGNKQKPFMTTEKAHYAYIDKITRQSIYQNRADIKFRVLARRKAISDSISKDKVAKWLWNNLEGRKLFFCSSIKQANLITNQTYHSKTDGFYLQKFISGQIDEICMVNAGGTGFTYKDIDHLVIVQVDSDKNGNTVQKICRTLLAQPNYTAQIWILNLNGTQDEIWVNSTLSKLDREKIEYINSKTLLKNLT